MRRHPYRIWFDGERHLLVEGDDFREGASVPALKGLLRKRAKQRGIRVKIRKAPPVGGWRQAFFVEALWK